MLFADPLTFLMLLVLFMSLFLEASLAFMKLHVHIGLIACFKLCLHTCNAKYVDMICQYYVNHINLPEGHSLLNVVNPTPLS